MNTSTMHNPLEIIKRWRQMQTLQNEQPRGVRLFQAIEMLPKFVRDCPISMRYYHLLRHLNWSQFPERNFSQVYLQEPTPYSTFAASYLVKLDQGHRYLPQLRQYLLDHPGLIWLFGFPLRVSTAHALGFNPEASLPTARHFTQLIRKLPNSCLQYLLDETVRVLRDQVNMSNFGHAISLDTKHIVAWVKENNPKAHVSGRFDKSKQPIGDHDCKLGCKKRHNQHGDIEWMPTPCKEGQSPNQTNIGEFYWGYASGVIATKVPDYGEFVLAELTQPFNQPDVSYFEPLLEQTKKRLGYKPLYGAFDAGFDAFYVYDYFHDPNKTWQQGFAAVPLKTTRSNRKSFSPDGHPLCQANQVMTLKYTFTSRTTRVVHERAHYICPLKDKSSQCPVGHKRWAKGGCTHRIPTSIGARLRHQIDRDSQCYKDIYKQRTATERINSQATELGIERPKLRNGQAITNQNTLIYVLINLRSIQRLQQQELSS